MVSLILIKHNNSFQLQELETNSIRKQWDPDRIIFLKNVDQ